MKTQYLFNLEKEIKPYLISLLNDYKVINNDIERIQSVTSISELAGICSINSNKKIIIETTDTTVSIKLNEDNKITLLEKIFFNINCSI